MKIQKPTILIPAKHIAKDAVLEVDYTWKNSKHLAIICHPNPKVGGNMLSKVVTNLYRFYRDKNINVVRFNYRGVGKSSGNIEYGQGEFIDALCVLNWAINQTNAAYLHISGFSFGGFIACLLSNEILENKLNNYKNIQLEKTILVAPSIEKNNPEGLKFNKENTFVIYGNKDEFINPNNIEKFSELFGLKPIKIEGATHFFNGKQEDLKNVLEDIYKSNS